MSGTGEAIAAPIDPNTAHCGCHCCLRWCGSFSAERRQQWAQRHALSRREFEIINAFDRNPKLMRLDYARATGVSINTVKTQIRSTLRKLEVADLVQALALFRRELTA